MKAMMYLLGKDEPVAVFDEVKLIQYNDNHNASPYRISFKSRQLSASGVMVELYRNENMQLKLEDGRTCMVLLQHQSLDMEGNSVGVLRVLGEIEE